MREQQTKTFSLDELLSLEALAILNKQGYVNFKTQPEDADVTGWIFRNTITSVVKEGFCLNTPVR